ncbi:hypothetical protein [Corynebacterium propinquum]|uniref:hypothetical protein n=1 Tax=Corynebacterium propinquum TaxID=43769 RepID=UPI000A55857A|nr:hypothetical protein [Corynebacterium propinquum]
MAGAFTMMANTYDERTSGHDDRVGGSFYDAPRCDGNHEQRRTRTHGVTPPCARSVT